MDPAAATPAVVDPAAVAPAAVDPAAAPVEPTEDASAELPEAAPAAPEEAGPEEKQQKDGERGEAAKVRKETCADPLGFKAHVVLIHTEGF